MSEPGGRGAPRKDGSAIESESVVQIALRVLDEGLAAWNQVPGGRVAEPSHRYLDGRESDGEV